jgi:hypothetical protein
MSRVRRFAAMAGVAVVSALGVVLAGQATASAACWPRPRGP